jgi:hypothetical protein
MKAVASDVTEVHWRHLRAPATGLQSVSNRISAKADAYAAYA